MNGCVLSNFSVDGSLLLLLRRLSVVAGFTLSWTPVMAAPNRKSRCGS
jgi:hypothetical protein